MLQSLAFQMDAVLQLLAGLLNLSCMHFVENVDSDGSQLAGSAEEEALQAASALLGLSAEMLLKVTTSRTLSAGRKADLEEYSVPLNVVQAQHSRDAIAKMVYAKVFNW